MANTGRIPLWLVGLIGGLAVITMLSLFIYGSYSGLGSSLWSYNFRRFEKILSNINKKLFFVYIRKYLEICLIVFFIETCKK